MVEIERLYTKERFEKIKSKFAAVDDVAQSVIDSAEKEDILSITISINSPREVTKAKVTTPNEYLKTLV